MSGLWCRSGSYQELERTARYEHGPLFTSLATGDVSTKLVEAYRVHPNRIKNLAAFGQGFHYDGRLARPVVYGMLPPTLSADYELPRKDQSRARGLRLHERFIVPVTAAKAAAP